MSDNFENNEEIIINFKKLWNIIWTRKFVIASCFIIFIIIAIINFNTTPKKYVTQAKLLINKTSSTNLSDINPFVVSEAQGGLGVGSFFNSTSNIDNEIEIMKSQLVIEKVIKDNDLKYKSGPKAGEYFKAKAFLNPNLKIDNKRGTNIITISYKSTDPEFSYKIVNSIINSYKNIYENINSSKASKDKEFLRDSYLQAQKSVNEKITQLKQFRSSGTGDISGILSLYDKRISNDSASLTNIDLDKRKMEITLEQEVEKLKMLKGKYEWISLVENMSQDATNIIILKQPEILEEKEFSEPNLNKNILLAILISFSVSSLLVFWFETTAKKLTFSAVSDKSYITSLNDPDFSEIEAKLITGNTEKIGIISLIEQDKTSLFVDLLKQNVCNNFDIEIIGKNDSFDKQISFINSLKQLIFLVSPGYTDKKFYKKIRNILNKQKNKNIFEFVIKYNFIF